MASHDGRCPSAYYRHGLLKPLGLPDPRNKRVLDTTTQLTSKGYGATNNVPSVKTICGDSAYHQLLAEFPDLTRPPNYGKEKARHSVVHHIKTTPGPRVYNKSRRLAPDRLKQVKAEFQVMIEQDVMRPSKSPWASPLHVVHKKDGNLRPCGDYRALNARTVPDRYTPPHVEDFAHHLYGKRNFQKLTSFALTTKSRSHRKILKRWQ